MHTKNIFLGALIVLGATGWLGFSQLSVSSSDQSAQQITRTFAVENMTCAACPITVKKAMSKVEGVESVEVDFKAKTATATFDPEKASCHAIAQAPTAVGFPATLMNKGEHEQDC